MKGLSSFSVTVEYLQVHYHYSDRLSPVLYMRPPASERMWKMLDSTTPVRPRPTRLAWLAVAASLVLAVGCSSSSTTSATNPSISAKADRSKDGALQKLTVTGSHFSPNGPVLITTLMAATGPDMSPYVEDTVQADASGKIKWEKTPPPCPKSDFGKGSWTLVTARDTNSGIAGSAALNGGNAPDCTSS